MTHDVTYLMLTRGRAPLARLAALNALEQTVACRLLVVCDDIDRDFPFDLEADVMESPSSDLSEKRLWSLQQVDTEYIAIWDDDNIFPVNRVELQLESIGDAPLCGSCDVEFWDIESDRIGTVQWNRNFPQDASILVRSSVLKELKKEALSRGWLARLIQSFHHQDLVRVDFKTVLTIHGDNLSRYELSRPVWQDRDVDMPLDWLDAYLQMTPCEVL